MLKAVILLSLGCFAVFTQSVAVEPEASLTYEHQPPSIAPSPYQHESQRQRHRHLHPRRHHSPSPSPAYPPSHAPVHSTAKPPASPPPPPPPKQAPASPPPHIVYPPVPRKFVAVQGVVYCESCRYAGIDTFWGATPILGATVKLHCNGTSSPSVTTAQTDKNGYFFIAAPRDITTYESYECRVFLVSSPLPTCPKPSNLRNGLTGAILSPSNVDFPGYPFALYNVGPFAFEPICPR